MEQTFLVKQVKGSELTLGDKWWADGQWNEIKYLEPKSGWMGNGTCGVRNYKDGIFIVKLPSPDILIPSEPDIEAWVKEHGYYGTCTSEWHEGLEEGAKWALSRLKELNPNLNFKSK